jgi:hypothetical protein
VNGSDYGYLSDTVRIPAGQASVTVHVSPHTYQTGSQSKVVAVALTAGQGYLLGTAQQASLTIEPLKPHVFVEALEPLAVAESDEPGYFYLWREGVTDSSLIVSLATGGTAVKNVDYQTIATTLSLAANEDERLIAVTPKSTATFPNGPKKVALTVSPSTNGKYLLGAASAAEVTLVKRLDTFEAWVARSIEQYFPLAQGIGTVFDAEPLFKFYAFGANADGSGTEGFPRPLMTGGKMIVKVKQPFWQNDVGYHVNGFTDLAAPAATAAGWVEVPAPAGQPTGAEWHYYRLDTDGPRGFISVGLSHGW